MNQQRIRHCFDGFPQLAPSAVAESIRNVSATSRAGIRNLLRARAAKRVSDSCRTAGTATAICQQIQQVGPTALQTPIKDPDRFPSKEVTRVAYYYLTVNALTQPTEVREPTTPYRRKG